MKNTILSIMLAITIGVTIGQCGNSTGVCGWWELFDGHIVLAPFVMFDTALAGWTVAILFMVFQFMLILKTRNMTIVWITSALFASMYVSSKILDATGNPILKPISGQIIFAILVIELAGLLYLWFVK